jgi:hypothetical protein
MYLVTAILQFSPTSQIPASSPGGEAAIGLLLDALGSPAIFSGSASLRCTPLMNDPANNDRVLVTTGQPSDHSKNARPRSHTNKTRE